MATRDLSILLDQAQSDPNSGIYLLNKIAGWPSLAVVTRMRKIFGIKRVGFAGTLDPLAEGLMIVATGKATRLLDYFHYLPKVYQAEFKCGESSASFDLGTAVSQDDGAKYVGRDKIEEVLDQLVGRQRQLAPSYSAKKVGGTRLYQLARRGEATPEVYKEVNIFAIKIISYHYPILLCEVNCSAGTYIRALARDLGAKLGQGVILNHLCRTAIGDLRLDEARDISQLSERGDLQPLPWSRIKDSLSQVPSDQ